MIFITILLLLNCILFLSMSPGTEAQAVSMSFAVSNPMDSSPNINACTSNTSSCNMRSAWAACNSYTTSVVSSCTITVSGTKNLQFNTTFGSLVLTSTAPPIQIQGSDSIISCLNCTGIAPITTLTGFPYTTGSLTNTNTARQNTKSVSFSACAADYLSLSNCAKYTGDTYIRLYNAANTQVAVSDDGCGMGSAIYYSVSTSGCQTYTLVMGCFGSNTCSMTVTGTKSSIGDSKDYSYFSYTDISSTIPTLAIRNLGFAIMDNAIKINYGRINLLVENCLFTNSTTQELGLINIQNLDRGQIIIRNCTFQTLRGVLGGGIVIIASTIPITIENALFERCVANTGAGMYIATSKYVNITRSQFSKCLANDYGGGVYLSNGNRNLLMADTVFSNCSSNYDGGGLYIQSNNQQIMVVQCEFTVCAALRNGGGVGILASGNITFSRTTWHLCHANQQGGGLYLYQGSQVLLSESRFTKCACPVTGGGIYAIYSSNLFIRSTNFSQAVSLNGACMVLQNSYNIFLNASIFYKCVARGSGGGILANSASSLMIDHSIFDQCQANTGGGMYLQSVSGSVWSGSVFTSSRATQGGGIYLNQCNELVLTSNTFYYCGATKEGGGLHFAASNANMSLSDNIFDGSYSVIGGGVYLYASNQNITFSSLFTNCHAQSNGGGMYIDNANNNIFLVHSKFTSNSADNDGGGLYISYSNSYLYIVASQFLQNVAGRQGGGVMTYNENYQLNFLDLTAFLHSKVFKQTQLTNVPYSKNYTAPAGTQQVILTFDRTSNIPSYLVSGGGTSSFGVWIYSLDRSVTYLRVGDNQFPGVKYPPVILNVTSFTVYSYACIFTLYIYPVASRSNKTNSTIFDGNIALNGAGGGLHLYYGSNNNIFVNTDFINNQARGIGSSYGGGFYSWISSLSTICTQLYFRNNSAQTSGGGMALMSGNFGSSVLNSYFTENSATISGGSLYIGSSNGQGTYMQQNEFYINDTIITDSTAANGGGIFFDINNNVILTNCTLQNNSASGGGGGLYLSTGNQLQIYRSVLSRNQADGNGGGIASFAVNGLYLEEVNLHANQAHVMGGGIYLQGNSLLSIHSEVLVENNQAMFGGGGIAISEAPLWDVLSPNISHMEISGNQAGRGSGLFLYALTASDRSLENVTFASNVAQVGGTVYWLYDSVMTSAPAGLDSSSVVFSNNEVGYGEIATQALALLTPTSYNVTVYDKTLTPAISLNMTDYYSQFVRVSNITTVSVAEYQDSSGVGSNCAGRPASLSGSDRFGSGVVMQQGVAEFASLEAFCSPGGSMAVQFQAQPADLTSIPSAISQLYYVQNTSTFQFRDCLDGEYQSDGQCLVCTNGSYSLVAGVAECSSCVGKDGVAACYSNQLVIDLGYWRRYDNNEAVLQCPVVDGCIGGSATGNALCAVGYEGPLCSVCSDGYFFKDGLCQSCDSTNEMSITVIVIIALFGLLIGAVMSYYCYFYVYVDMVDLKRQIVDAINRGVPGPQLTIFQLLYLWIRKKMQDITVKVKIFISTFQVVSGCTSVFDVNMPNAFAAFADAFSFVNLDVYSIFPIGCAQQMNFMDELLLTTVAPLLCVGLMGLFLAAVYARMKHMASDEAIRQYEYMKDKVLTAFFFLTYLVLPSVSVTIFQTFICQNIDPDNEDSSQEDLFLVADMNISCTSTYYYSWVLYACMMLVVYPIGIPLCYFVMLYRNRAGIITRDEVLEKEEKEEKDGRTMSQRIADSLDKSVDYIHNPLKESVKSLDRVSSMIDMDDSLHKLPPQVARLSFLWAAYEPGFWYWEVIETFRRIMLTAVLSAIAPGTSSQNVFSIIVSVLFIKLYASHKPYEEDSDDALAELGQVQIFFTFLAVMCSQNDLLPGYYDTSMGVLLIVINLSLPLVAFYYEMHSYYEEQKALEAEGNEEDAGRGDSCILSRAKESFSKINARMFGPKAAKPSGKKVRRQSQSQTEADDSFSFAMHYIYQQNKQQPRPIVELGVAEGGDMEKGSWVEMNPIRQASIVDRNSARMSTKMKDIKNLEVDIRKPVVKDPENKQEEGEEVKSRSSVL